MDRKKGLTTRGFTPQLFLFLILPLTAVLIVITLGGAAMHQQAMRALVGDRDVRAARAAANALQQQLIQRQLALQTLAVSAAVDDGQETFPIDVAHLDAVFDRGLALVSREAQPIATVGDEYFWQEVMKQAGFFNLYAVGGESQVAAVHIPDTEPVILVSHSLGGGNTLVGALTAASLFEPVLGLIVDPEQGGVAFVVDSSGQVLFHSGEPHADEEMASHPGVAEALEGSSGAAYLPVGRGEHVAAFSAIPGVNWALVIEEPWTAVASPELTLTENASLVLIPVVLFALIALWFAAHRIVQPLKNLEGRAARLAWGEFAAIETPVGGIQEIQNLQQELIHMARKLRASQQGLRDYIGAITQAQEEERLRLARDLHDDTLQALIALKQRIQLAELTGQHAPADSSRLKAIGEMADDTIQNLRRVTRGLRPIYLEDLGVAPALEMLVKEADRLHPAELHFSRRGQERRFPPETELALFRIAQEALNNSLRHSSATQAGVDIHFRKAETELRIWDDGIGFTVPESPAGFTPQGHYGLLGLYERAEMIGARLSIQSSADGGTVITINYPEGS
jgi:signal transduction histidine kinase